MDSYPCKFETNNQLNEAPKRLLTDFGKIPKIGNPDQYVSKGLKKLRENMTYKFNPKKKNNFFLFCAYIFSPLALSCKSSNSYAR